MSEEFLRVAKKELSEDIVEIGNILDICSSDVDATKNASSIEKHIHKIKGLAPMMNQEEIGQIATLLDKILKTLSDKPLPGLYSTLLRSHAFMKNTIDGNGAGYDELYSTIMQAHKDLL